MSAHKIIRLIKELRSSNESTIIFGNHLEDKQNISNLIENLEDNKKFYRYNDHIKFHLFKHKNEEISNEENILLLFQINKDKTIPTNKINKQLPLGKKNEDIIGIIDYIEYYHSLLYRKYSKLNDNFDVLVLIIKNIL